jgi:hypothetical protein
LGTEIERAVTAQEQENKVASSTAIEEKAQESPSPEPFKVMEFSIGCGGWIWTSDLWAMSH